MSEEEAKQLYRLRKQTVEPVFGIIKQALGFRQFLPRGLEKLSLERPLVSSAYNLKRGSVPISTSWADSSAIQGSRS